MSDDSFSLLVTVLTGLLVIASGFYFNAVGKKKSSEPVRPPLPPLPTKILEKIEEDKKADKQEAQEEHDKKVDALLTKEQEQQKALEEDPHELNKFLKELGEKVQK